MDRRVRVAEHEANASVTVLTVLKPMKSDCSIPHSRRGAHPWEMGKYLGTLI